MKKIGILLFVIVFISSCVEVKFEEAQPQGVKALESIPNNFQGTYLLGDSDTVQISSNSFQFSKPLGGKKEAYELSNIFILKKWQNTYFVNLKEEDAKYWSVFFIKKNKEHKLMIGFLGYSDSDTTSIQRLGEITQLKSYPKGGEEDDGYVINPSKKELKQILKEIPLEELGKLIKIED